MENTKTMADPSEVLHTMLQEQGALIISEDYKKDIATSLLEDVLDDLNASADPENWNDDDVRLAVGRVLTKRLGLFD